ncbi:MAG: hypothetical protein ACYDC8_03070 [Gammaproteobacteria bacterium]
MTRVSLKRYKIVVALCLATSINTAFANEELSNDTFEGAWDNGAPKTFACIVNPLHQEKDNTVSVNPDVAEKIVRNGGYLGPCATYGDKRSLGDGYFQTYSQLQPDGSPWGIGVEFPKSTFNNLPTTRHDGMSCFDVDGNGRIEMDGNANHVEECANGHELVLNFPFQTKVAPFKYVQLNWQPYGHVGGVYAIPHIDFHFFIQDFVARNLIRVGPCRGVTNCDDYNTARKPVPAMYMHPDFVDVGAVVARMGNHYLDLNSPEYHGHTFDETFVYGTYDGKLTFWEIPTTIDYLKTDPSTCTDIRQPYAYQESGYYPARYCIRYRPRLQDYTVSLEGFVFHQAQ